MDNLRVLLLGTAWMSITRRPWRARNELTWRYCVPGAQLPPRKTDSFRYWDIKDKTSPISIPERFATCAWVRQVVRGKLCCYSIFFYSHSSMHEQSSSLLRHSRWWYVGLYVSLPEHYALSMPPYAHSPRHLPHHRRPTPQVSKYRHLVPAARTYPQKHVHQHVNAPRTCAARRRALSTLPLRRGRVVFFQSGCAGARSRLARGSGAGWRGWGMLRRDAALC